MLIDPKYIGSVSEPQTFEVEKGAVRRFAEAIGDDNPLAHDEVYAQQQGYASLVAPPTFPTTFRVPLPMTFEISRVLHGEQEYAYTRPIVAGDRLRCVSRVVAIYEKHGSLGAMTFLVTTIEGQDGDGQPVFTGSSTAILR